MTTAVVRNDPVPLISRNISNSRTVGPSDDNVDDDDHVQTGPSDVAFSHYRWGLGIPLARSQYPSEVIGSLASDGSTTVAVPGVRSDDDDDCTCAILPCAASSRATRKHTRA